MASTIATASRFLGALLTVTVAISGTIALGASDAMAATRPAGKHAPATGTLFGAYVDPDARWSGNDAHKAEVNEFEGQLARKLAISQHYYSWSNTFPSGLEQWDVQNGRIPLVTWEPWGITLQSIVDGQHDALIRQRARGLRDLGAPAFLRWGHEMNGNWYPWDGTHNNDSGTTNGPAKYVAAYRKIHGLFRAEGATNVAFVWSPNAENVPNQSWNHWRNYYPGDAYVDWVGPDGYNWGTTKSWSSWRSFASVFGPVYNDYAARKPLMIAEVGSAEQGGSKATWITAMQTAIKTSMPSIAALVWFHVNKEADWRPSSSATAMTAYKAVAADPHFGGTLPVPAPAPSPTTSPTPAPAPTPTTSPTPAPSPTASPTPTPAPTASPTPTPTTSPTPTPSVTPTPVATASPTPTPVPSVTPVPTPTEPTPTNPGGGPGGTSAKLVPAKGALFGAFTDPNARWNGVEEAKAEVAGLEQRLGRKLDIDHHYYSWADSFPTDLERWDVASGRTPMVTWEPWGTTLAGIASGAHDATIRARARGLRDLAAPVFLRWGQEMNGDWYPWGGVKNNDAGTTNGPAKYVAAYRRIHDLFAAEGATNVVWVWSPNAESVPNQAWNHWSSYYPGDAYVDWVAADGYNWGTSRTWSKWRTFRSIFGAVYNEYAARKPIMIAETGSVERGGSKADWLLDMWFQLQVNMPKVRALVYFDKAYEFSASTSTTSFAAFRQLAGSEYFRQISDQTPPAVSGPAPSKKQVRTKTRISYRVSEPARVVVRVERASGKVVRTLRASSWMSPLSAKSAWNGRKASGQKVSPGRYRVKVVARDAGGNRTVSARWVRVLRRR